VMTEYEFHPESKCADAFGNPCQKANDWIAAKEAH
jgi:hypothetical protein